MRYVWRHVYLRSIALACVLDILALGTVAALAHGLLSLGSAPPAAHVVTSTTLALGVPALIYAHAYALPDLGDPARSVLAVAKVGGAALVLLAAAAALGWVTEPYLRATLAALGLGIPALALLRWYLPSILAQARSPRRVLVVGTQDLAARIGLHLHQASRLGVELVGFLETPSEEPGAAMARMPVLGKAADLESVLRREPVDHIVLAAPPGSAEGRVALLHAWSAGVTVEGGLVFYERLCGRLYMRSVDPHVFATEAQLSSRQPGDWLKRTLDVVGASLGLALGAPLVALAAVAIRLESPGGVLFRQARIGAAGRVFHITKLRTMRSDAEKDGARWAARSDSRITRVGHVLRKTRIDEIPQLWNVLRGEMSLVGPRPERPEFAAELEREYPYFSLRSMVKPGLTGWAQVRQGYVNDVRAWENKLELDLYYVKNRSLAMDLMILLQTTQTLLLMRGV